MIWRPNGKRNLFCIPDVHGAIDLLEILLERILPLNEEDELVFLGDYIDRHPDSHKVIDRLIELSGEKSIHFLKGNHEYLLLVAAGKINKSVDSRGGNYRTWLGNGGLNTLQGYLSRKNSQRESLLVRPEDLSTIIPKEHLDFMFSCKKHHKVDNFTFVHGGFNPNEHIDLFDEEVVVWDRSLIKYIKSGGEASWTDTVVCGHSGPEIVIRDNYMMLDCGSPGVLMVAELHSRKALYARGQSAFDSSDVEEGVWEETLLNNPKVSKEKRLKRLDG